MKVFLFTRDLDALRKNREIISRALGSGVNITDALKYSSKHCSSAQEVLTQRDFGLYVIAQHPSDMTDFGSVLDHVVLKEETRKPLSHVVVVSGLPLVDYVEEYGISLFKRPDGYLQSSDTAEIASLVNGQKAFAKP